MTEQRYVREKERFRKRAFRLSIAASLFFFLLLTRLWYLQVIETERLKELSENNRLRSVPVAASRGAILVSAANTLRSATQSPRR